MKSNDASSEELKTDKKNKAAISRNFQKSYLKSGFIAANLYSSKNRHTTYPCSQSPAPKNTASHETGPHFQKRWTAAIYIESFTIESERCQSYGLLDILDIWQCFLHNGKHASKCNPFFLIWMMSLSPAVPNPPGPFDVLAKTTSSIEIKWREAALMTGTSFKYRLSITSPEERVLLPSTHTSHTFTSLLSGTPYNISITTVGALNFESEEVQIHMVTTSKGFISALQRFHRFTLNVEEHSHFSPLL